MKRVAMLLAMFPVVAWAHPGHHLFSSAASYMAHLLSEPDHVAMIVAAGLGMVWLIGSRRKKHNRDL